MVMSELITVVLIGIGIYCVTQSGSDYDEGDIISDDELTPEERDRLSVAGERCRWCERTDDLKMCKQCECYFCPDHIYYDHCYYCHDYVYGEGSFDSDD